MENNHWLSISKEDSNVFINIPDSIQDKMIEHFTPFFNISKIEKPANNDSWKIYGDTCPEEIWEDEVILKMKHSHTSEPPSKCAIMPEKKYIVVLEPASNIWKFLLIYRLTRDILKNATVNNKNVAFFSSAFIKYNNKGICIMGDKYSKTSTMLSILALKNASFISYNDLSIEAIGNVVTGYGWPRTISIQNNIIKAINNKSNIFPIISKLEHPYNSTEMNKYFYYIYPCELVRFTNNELIEECKIDTIIFSEQTDSDKLYFDEVKGDELQSHLNKYFTSNINSQFEGLAEYFVSKDKRNNEYNFNTLVANVQGFKLSQNFHNIDNVVEIFNKTF